jgi:hypothetical protein
MDPRLQGNLIMDPIGPNAIHVAWSDPRIGLDVKLLYYDNLPTGEQYVWEWKYLHHLLKLSQDPWDSFAPVAAHLTSDYLDFPGCHVVRSKQSHVVCQGFGTGCMIRALAWFVTQRQSRCKPIALNLLLSLTHAATECAIGHVRPEDLVLKVNAAPASLPSRIKYLVLLNTGEVMGMDAFMPTLGSKLAQAWDSFGRCTSMQPIQSSLKLPSLEDLIKFGMWCRMHDQLLYDCFSKSCLSACLTCASLLLESHVKHDVQPVSNQTLLPLLVGRSKKKFRKVDATNKRRWLDKLKASQYKRGFVLQVLTKSITPVCVQRCEGKARCLIYWQQCKIIFEKVKCVHLNWDSSLHTEDTCVSVAYSPDIDIACFPAIQVLQKPMQSDVDCDEIRAMGLEKKLQRMSAYSYLLGIRNMLRSIGLDLESFRAPTGYFKPLRSNELRVRDPSTGVVMIYNELTNTYSSELPPGFDFLDQMFLGNGIDQGSIGMCSCSHLEAMGFNTVQRHDRFHRCWNDLKTAFQASSVGAWAVVLMLTLVMNLAYGPFGKGSWFEDKKEWLIQLRQDFTHNCAEFKNSAREIAEECGLPPPETEEDFLHIWDLIPEMANFVNKGPIVKLMRWFSWFEAARWYTGSGCLTRVFNRRLLDCVLAGVQQLFILVLMVRFTVASHGLLGFRLI